jgi:hypothetical protein
MSNFTFLQELVKSGNLELLKFFRKYLKLGFSQELMTQAVEYNQFQVIEYFKSLHLKLNSPELYYFALNGHLKIVQELLQKGIEFPDEEDESLNLISSGQLEVLKFLIENNHCSLRFSMFQEAIKEGQIRVLETLLDLSRNSITFRDLRNLAELAIHYDQLEAFKILLDLLPTKYKKLCYVKACQPSKKKFIEILIKYGVNLENWIIRSLIDSGEIYVLKILISHGFFIDPIYAEEMALGGNLKFLKFLYRNKVYCREKFISKNSKSFSKEIRNFLKI